MADCNNTDSDAYLDVWYSPRLASLYAVMGVIFSIIYIPCIVVMTDEELWVNTCYKVMFIVGILDICTLTISAILPSIYMFVPLGFDCYPIADQFLASWACQLFWNAYCFMAVTLILNRCVFIASPAKWHEKLFCQGRVWIWAAAAIAYGSIFVAVYAGPYGTIHFDSGIGTYYWPETDVVGAKFTTFNNTSTAFLIPIGYVLLALIVRRMRSLAGANSDMTTPAQHRLQLQAVLICAPTCIAALFYYIAPKLTSDVVVYQILHIVWIISNGCNGLIYLALNKTIRNKVLNQIKSLFVAVYASPYGTIHFHTGIGTYYWPAADVIGANFTTFNNTSTAFLIPIGYVTLALIIHKKRSRAGAYNDEMITAEHRLQLQCTDVYCCAFYYITPKLTSDVVVYQVLHVVWIMSNGCNGMIYLALNKTIRSKVMELTGMSKLTIFNQVRPISIVPSNSAEAYILHR